MKNIKEKIYGKIAISNRHVHLTKELYEELFDEPEIEDIKEDYLS